MDVVSDAACFWAGLLGMELSSDGTDGSLGGWAEDCWVDWFVVICGFKLMFVDTVISESEV